MLFFVFSLMLFFLASGNLQKNFFCFVYRLFLCLFLPLSKKKMKKKQNKTKKKRLWLTNGC